MSRADNQAWSRFDWRLEMDNIYSGMQGDLALPVGQVVPWYVFDSVNTEVDPIFDIASTGNGRQYLSARPLQVMNAVKVEGTRVTNDRGRYTIDTLRVVFSADAARLAGLSDLIVNPNNHTSDRLVYENKVFDVTNLRVRGEVYGLYSYAVIAADCQQTKREELINDPQFRAYIALDQA